MFNILHWFRALEGVWHREISCLDLLYLQLTDLPSLQPILAGSANNIIFSLAAAVWVWGVPLPCTVIQNKLQPVAPDRQYLASCKLSLAWLHFGAWKFSPRCKADFLRFSLLSKANFLGTN